MTTQTSVGRFTKSGIGSVNTYWIETSAAVIVIDGQRELSNAKAARKRIEQQGKPIVAVFLTHPHPDHFGGIGVFAPEGSGIPVYSSRQTRDSIAEDRFDLIKKSREAAGADFPDQPRLPDVLLSDSETVVIDSVELVAHEMGAGEAESMTVLHIPARNVVFASDTIQHGMTAYLLEGRSRVWLDQLARVGVTFPADAYCYPGHGDPGTLAVLIEWQRNYIEKFQSLVQKELQDGHLSQGASTAVRDEMNRIFPGYLPVAAIPTLLDMNVEAIANEFGARKEGKP